MKCPSIYRISGFAAFTIKIESFLYVLSDTQVTGLSMLHGKEEFEQRQYSYW